MKKGGICRAQPIVTDFYTPQERHWPACYKHLTTTERDEYVAVREAKKEAQERWWLAARPACWAWPVAIPFKAWTPNFDVGPADDQYTQEAAEDLLKLCQDSETRASFYLSDWQAGRCAICASQGGLIDDHDHTTGLVRGLLCRSCNTREGLDRGSVGPFAKYRTKNPASILGVQVRYWDPFTGDYAQPVVEVPSLRTNNPWLLVQAKRRASEES